MSFKLKNIQKNIPIPSSYTKAQREMIGNLIIEQIKKRTSQGKDVNGIGFKKYEPEYADEKGSSKVNLDLTGDMLSELEVISDKVGEVRIGIPKDSEVAGQAEGNFIGSYGSKKPNPKKARPILGVSQKELDIIYAKVDQSTPKEASQASQVSTLASRLADSLFGGMIKDQGYIGTEDEE